MKTISITGSLRTDLGKTGAREARENDLVPCVMYGAGKQVHFTMDKRSFEKITYTADIYNVLITVDGTTYSTLLQESQFHPVNDSPIHADFLVLEENKEVNVALPVVLTGTSIGVKNGGKLRTPMRKVKVAGTLASIPESIKIDITDMRIGSAIKVGEMKEEGLRFLDPNSNVIVSVKTARGAVDEEEAAATEGAAEAAPEATA